MIDTSKINITKMTYKDRDIEYIVVENINGKSFTFRTLYKIDNNWGVVRGDDEEGNPKSRFEDTIWLAMERLPDQESRDLMSASRISGGLHPMEVGDTNIKPGDVYVRGHTELDGGLAGYLPTKFEEWNWGAWEISDIIHDRGTNLDFDDI